MAGKRMLHRNICTSKKINKLSDFAEVMYYRIYTHVDDYGQFYSEPGTIKEICFPIKKVALEAIKEALDELKSVKLMSFSSVDGRKVLRITGFDTFQNLRKDRQKHSYFGKPRDIPRDIPKDKAKAKEEAKANVIANAPNPEEKPDREKAAKAAKEHIANALKEIEDKAKQADQEIQTQEEPKHEFAF